MDGRGESRQCLFTQGSRPSPRRNQSHQSRRAIVGRPIAPRPRPGARRGTSRNIVPDFPRRWVRKHQHRSDVRYSRPDHRTLESVAEKTYLCGRNTFPVIASPTKRTQNFSDANRAANCARIRRPTLTFLLRHSQGWRPQVTCNTKSQTMPGQGTLPSITDHTGLGKIIWESAQCILHHRTSAVAKCLRLPRLHERSVLRKIDRWIK